MKIGILGGSFDPPHIGHLILAEQAQQMYNLDKIIFIPCNESINKISYVSGFERCEMVNECLKDNNNFYFKYSIIDIGRGNITYTIDTLNDLKQTYNVEKFYIIVGFDQLNNIHNWKLYKEIKSEHIIIGEKLPCNQYDKITIRSRIIRKYVKEGISIKHLVTPSVRKYIYDNELYKQL